MYKQPYLRALCGSKKYPYLYGWRLDLYPTPILVEFPVQLYTFTLKIWLLGPLPHWNLKWPSFLWVWIFFAWSLTLQWFLFSKPIIVSSHPNLLLLFRRRAVFPWVFRHNKPQLIDQSERAHWFGYCINWDIPLVFTWYIYQENTSKRKRKRCISVAWERIYTPYPPPSHLHLLRRTYTWLIIMKITKILQM